MGEMVIAVWRSRAEPRNGFRSTMEQGSLGLVFFCHFGPIRELAQRHTSITITAWFHFKKNSQPQTDGVNQRRLHNRAPTKADWIRSIRQLGEFTRNPDHTEQVVDRCQYWTG